MFASLLILSLIISGCSSQSSSETKDNSGKSSSGPKSGGILRAAIVADPVGLDPHTADAASTTRIIENVYSSLLRMDTKKYGEFTPDLAEKWEISPDGKTYTFHIIHGVKFHNGREMKADDVKYSIERIMNPATGSPRAYMFAKVTSVNVIDEYTVEFKLKEPYTPLLAALASPLNAIVPKEVVEKNGDLKKVAVGTGPFKFVKMIPGTTIELVKNKDYYVKGLPYLDGITFTPIPDDTSRTTGLRTGNVDFIEQIPHKDIDILKKDKSIVVQGGPGTTYDYIGFNMNKAPFNDVKVRQAISYVIDRKELVQTALFGHATVINGGPIPKTHWAYADFTQYTPNIEKAKQLLKEAGYEKGFDATIKVGSAYKMQVAMAQIVKEQLKQVGINVKVQQMEWGLFLNDVTTNKNFDLTVLGWVGAVDPDDWLYAQFHSGEKWNFYGLNDPQTDALLEKGQGEQNQDVRKKIYADAEKRIAEMAPYVFFEVEDQYEAISPKLKNYVTQPTGSFTGFRDAWLAH
jgi:peptide/nickel transport system substrate-binding protein